MGKELSRLVNAVELLDVFLKKSNCSCSVSPTSLDPSKIEVSCDYKFEFDFQVKAGVLICFIMSEVLGNIGGEECFYFRNQFVLVYKVTDIVKSPSEKVLKHFLNTTALFNSYPYHREQVQGQSIKMGIPPIIMPLLKSIPEEMKREVNES